MSLINRSCFQSMLRRCGKVMLFVALSIIVACFSNTVFGQTRYVAPVERTGYLKVTSYDTLRAFLKEVGSAPRIRVEPLTNSKMGRTLFVAKVTSSKVFGEDKGKLRVLLFAQQHGDEHTGKEALSILLARFASGDLKGLLTTMDLLVVPQMNPDGCELYQRRTSDSIDLNRNHLLLTSPETKALHDLFYEWMPQVTLDVHEYGTLSRAWSDSGFIRIADVQLGMLTNVNTSTKIRDLQHKLIYPFMASRMKAQGYYFQEYIVGSPSDRVRHSTTEINDGRQSFGVLGTVSFIQEGIKWQTREEQLKRRVQSQLASIGALLEFCSTNARNIMQIVKDERSRLVTLAGQPVALRMDHFHGKGVLRIPVRMVKTGRDSVWQVRPYHGEVRLQLNTSLPKLYLIQEKDSAIVNLLRRHHVKIDVVKELLRVDASEYVIDTVSQVNIEEETQPLVAVTRRQIRYVLSPGDFIISTRQPQSLLIAIILEPQSMWGLTKYEQFSYLIKEKQYPIVRIP